MTTVVVTKKNGYACIAADTLATYGDMRETAELIANSDKLVRIGDAWVAPTGPASAQLVLRHFIASYDELPVLEDIDGIFDFLTHFQRALREEYFVQGKEDSHDDFESMRMELLIASPGGLFGAYPQRSVQEFKKFYAFGSGAEYALGAMAAAWDHVESAEELARIGVETASRFDVNSDLPLTLRRIALREGQQEPPLFAPRVVRDGAQGPNGAPERDEQPDRPEEPGTTERANGDVRVDGAAPPEGRSAHGG